MKKILSLVLVLSILLSSMVFADQARIKPIQNKDRLAVMALNSQILENSTTIKALTQETKSNTRIVQTRVKRIMSNNEDLSIDELENLKTFLLDVKDGETEIKDTIGQIAALREQIKTLREEREFQGLKEIYTQIIAIQEQRIKALNMLNNKMTRFIERSGKV